MDLFGMPTGGPTMTVKLMTGENLKSPPPSLLLPHQIWYACKSCCCLLLLSRAESCAFALAGATTTRRSSLSCERCPTASSEESAPQQWELLKQRWAQLLKAPVIFHALASFYFALDPCCCCFEEPPLGWACPSWSILKVCMHAIVMFFPGRRIFVISFMIKEQLFKKSIVASVCKERNQRCFYRVTVVLKLCTPSRVSCFRIEFISSLSLSKTFRHNFVWKT